MADSDPKPASELDRSQEELERLEHLKKALQSSGIACTQVRGSDGTYAFVSQGFADLLGCTREEVMAADPYQIFKETIHPDDLEEERHALDRVAKGEIDSYQLDRRLIRKNGEERWVRVVLSSLRDRSGRLDSIFVAHLDIHDDRSARVTQQQLEDQLRQAQKLGALGKLAGGVAHDFNNRLVVIMAYAELLKRELPPESPLVHHAEMVLDSAQAAADLTRQLLAYSRRQVLKPEAFDLNQAVDRSHRMLERLIGEHIDLRTMLAAKHPIYFDPGQIEQVILNLVINARDAMPNGGRLLLETGDLRLAPGEDAVLPPGDYVVLSVTDTGTGIAADILPHVFEPFFTTKEVGQGTGLGLSMVDGIVHQSGGATRIETALGRGTSFRVLLPRAGADAPVRYKAEVVAARAPRFETVLVCDDDEGVRKVLLEVLRLRGYRLLEARNGRHALDVARTHGGPIDLLVTDLVMPDLGGMELTDALRERLPELKVLYVSGYSDRAQLLSQGLDRGTHFLAKPFLPGALTRAVVSILEQPSRGATRREAGE